MTELSKLAKQALATTNELANLVTPASTQSGSIDADALVEQHQKLTAVVVELLEELARRASAAADILYSQTLSNVYLATLDARLIQLLTRDDRRIITGLAELQVDGNDESRFSGKELYDHLHGAIRGSNYTARLTKLSEVAPALIELSHYGLTKFFRLTAEGVQFARLIAQEG